MANERIEESMNPITNGLRELTAELKAFKKELKEFNAAFERDLKRLQLEEEKNANRRSDALKEFKAGLREFKVDHGKSLERLEIEAEKNVRQFRIELKEFKIDNWRIFKTLLDGFHWKLLFNVGGVVMVVAPLSLAAYSMLGPAYFSMVIAALVLVNIF